MSISEIEITVIYLCVLFLLYRIRNCLAQLYAKDITPDDKQELDEALQREVNFIGYLQSSYHCWLPNSV